MFLWIYEAIPPSASILLMSSSGVWTLMSFEWKINETSRTILSRRSQPDRCRIITERSSLSETWKFIFKKNNYKSILAKLPLYIYFLITTSFYKKVLFSVFLCFSSRSAPACNFVWMAWKFINDNFEKKFEILFLILFFWYYIWIWKNLITTYKNRFLLKFKRFIRIASFWLQQKEIGTIHTNNKLDKDKYKVPAH